MSRAIGSAASRWRTPALILALSAASFARMYFFNSSKIAALGTGDEAGYHQLAVNLLEGRGFSQSTAPPYRPNIYHTPAFPVFLASVYLVFGVGNFEAVRLLQVLMMLGAGLAIWRAVGVLLEDAVLALSSLALFSAFSFGYSDRGVYGFLLSETLTIFLICIAFLCAALCFKRPRPAFFLACGALLGLAALTRPSNMLYPVLLAAFFAWRRTRPRDILLFAVSAALLVAPWCWRNHRIFSRWTLSYPAYGLQLMLGLTANPDVVIVPNADLAQQGFSPQRQKSVRFRVSVRLRPSLVPEIVRRIESRSQAPRFG